MTALFATAQQQTLGYLGQIEAERRALVRMDSQRQAIDLAVVLLMMFPDQREFAFPDDSGRTLLLQDVGGLIDLNTAHPDLLDRLAVAIRVPKGGMERLRSWRRTGLRLLDLNDFVRLTGLPWQQASRLPFLATVSSGRFGIDPDTSPQGVLDIARDRGSDVPDQFIDLPTSSVFAVWLIDEADRPIHVGTVQLQPNGDGRILEFK
ncbi:MAG: hypothetical protein MUE52_01075 [Tabrizicola sp.]|nr:hypothetical protein [Tabrizicola sp.]